MNEGARETTKLSERLWRQILQEVKEKTPPGPWTKNLSRLETPHLAHGVLMVAWPGQPPEDEALTRVFADAAQSAFGRLVGVELVSALAGGQACDGVLSEDLFPLNREYRFDTFVTGPSNQLAHAACVAISERPGQAYNPLFIHGNVGLGKTHLLQAACHSLLEGAPETRICYMSCETFINHFIEAVQAGALQSFRTRYRHADVLVVDDIHSLAKGERSQEEFFHTFNALYQLQKQIVLSSDRSPAEISKLEERLVSRFQSGLVARIDKPDYDTRLAIVRKKAEQRKTELPEEVPAYIASRIDSNIRELEGALTGVLGMSELTGKPINMDLARQVLEGTVAPANTGITIHQILECVVRHYHLKLAEIQSRRRTKSVVLPRQMAMYLARELTRYSLQEIGGYFGGRDHTTVMHACNRITQAKESDPKMQALLGELTKQITQTTQV